MLKLENSIRGLSFSRVAFDLTIQGQKRDPMADTRYQKPSTVSVNSFMAPLGKRP